MGLLVLVVLAAGVIIWKEREARAAPPAPADALPEFVPVELAAAVAAGPVAVVTEFVEAAVGFFDRWHAGREEFASLTASVTAWRRGLGDVLRGMTRGELDANTLREVADVYAGEVGLPWALYMYPVEAVGQLYACSNPFANTDGTDVAWHDWQARAAAGALQSWELNVARLESSGREDVARRIRYQYTFGGVARRWAIIHAELAVGDPSGALRAACGKVAPPPLVDLPATPGGLPAVADSEFRLF